VDVLGFVAYMFTYIGEEGNYIMVDDCIDFMNPVYIKVCFGFNDFYCFLSALASQAAISTSSMVCHSFLSSQILPITGRVYLGII